MAALAQLFLEHGFGCCHITFQFLLKVIIASIGHVVRIATASSCDVPDHRPANDGFDAHRGLPDRVHYGEQFSLGFFASHYQVTINIAVAIRILVGRKCVNLILTGHKIALIKAS
jgi:hypothetical protein